MLLYVLFVLCRSLYCLCAYMCTEQLPPGGYTIAVKYISYHINATSCRSCITFPHASPELLTLRRPCRSPAEILGSNPTGAWIFVCCECRVLAGRGLCDELITRPEESYRLCCVVVCDLETSRMGAPYIYDISRLRVKDVQSESRCLF